MNDPLSLPQNQLWRVDALRKHTSSIDYQKMFFKNSINLNVNNNLSNQIAKEKIHPISLPR